MQRPYGAFFMSGERSDSTGGVVAPIAIFLPGLLLVEGTLPFYDALRRRRSSPRAAMRGTNAVAVGILAAALYNPVWTNAAPTSRDFVLAVTGFPLLTVRRILP
ncbi:MAG: chromate transporter, chromate ion transporter family [Rhodospirillales bacterium]|jgi:chromate transporter|nr:chromate transporter, chromate ion transporter family [Rhodospirillales bacterium]